MPTGPKDEKRPAGVIGNAVSAEAPKPGPRRPYRKRAADAESAAKFQLP